ncbi:MAG: hypothetical protein HY902_06790 [Deltaproteobacteria bacterium]|nr:hypothetical protein [Deltaproteobacteria bacterium]
MGRGLGHAKLILVGEHWVLDGARALAIGLPELHTQVELIPAESSDIPADAQAAQMLQLALEQVGWHRPLRATIASNVPIRRGLGSSAALAVALVRAAHALEHSTELHTSEVALRARALEALVHGQSSGLDPAAAAAGGTAVLFQQGTVLNQPSIHANLAPAHWLVVDVGQGQPTRTAIAVAKQAREEMGDLRRHTLLASVTRAAESAADALHRGNLSELALALRQAGDAIEPLGIVNEPLQLCRTRLLEAGALASKSSGAGLGGVTLGLFADADTAHRAQLAIADRGWASWISPLATPATRPKD